MAAAKRAKARRVDMGAIAGLAARRFLEEHAVQNVVGVAVRDDINNALTALFSCGFRHGYLAAMEDVAGAVTRSRKAKKRGARGGR